MPPSHFPPLLKRELAFLCIISASLCVTAKIWTFMDLSKQRSPRFHEITNKTKKTKKKLNTSKDVRKIHKLERVV